MGGKGALHYLSIVPKASIYVPKVMRKPVMGSNTVSETYTHMFPFRSARSFKNWPRQSIWSVMAEYGRLSMGGKGALNYLPIVPKASIYVPNVIANQLWAITPCLRLSCTCFSSEMCEVLKFDPDSQIGA